MTSWTACKARPRSRLWPDAAVVPHLADLRYCGTLFSLFLFAELGFLALVRHGHPAVNLTGPAPDRVLALLTILAWPVLEEILFRGVILNGFANRHGFLKANLLASVLFGLVHVRPHMVVICTAFGWILGLVYRRTRSLPACVGLHVLNNLLAVATSWWPDRAPFLLAPVAALPMAHLVCLVRSCRAPRGISAPPPPSRDRPSRPAGTP